MKFNSPFLVLLLTTLLYSCDKSATTTDKQSDAEVAIAHYHKQLATDTVLSNKIQHAQKAVQVAQNAQDTSLLYQTVLHQLDYAITEAYPDSVPYYLDKLHALSSKIPNPNSSTAYILSRKADYHFGLKDYTKAYDFYNASKALFEKGNDSLRTGYNLIKMAHIQQMYNDYSGSEETLTEALVFLDSQNTNQDYLVEVYNLLGISYTALHNYDEAIANYKEAKKGSTDVLFQKIIDHNIALCYLENQQYAKALGEFSALYGNQIIRKDESSFAKVMDNFGYAQFKNDGVSGLPLMEKALSIRTKKSDERGMVYSYINLAEYHGKHNPSLAAQYAQKAYTLATKIGAIDNRMKSLELLATFGGSQYNQDYFRLNDSVQAFRQKAKNQFAKIRFDATKERNENQQMKIKQAENEVRNLVGGIILSGLFLGIVVLLVVTRIRHKREKIKQRREEQYETETRIAKKLHDELANDLFNTMTFAELRDLSSPENKEVLIDNLDRIYEQTRNISRENNTIDTGENYLRHLKDMLSGYSSGEVNIILKEIDSIEWTTIDPAKKIVIYRVLQELLVNMKKHSKATLVVIGFEKIKKNIKINYTDNGVGIGPDEQLRKNGLQNVENRILSIKGKLTFEPTPQRGFKMYFIFPS